MKKNNNSVNSFIARKFLYKEPADGYEESTSASTEARRTKKQLQPIARISAIGVGLGLSLILLSLFIVQGFKNEIRNNINGFIGNIRIFHPDNNFDQFSLPLGTPHDLLKEIESNLQALDHSPLVYTFADRMAMLKTDSTFQGLMFHGVDSLYDRTFFSNKMVAGEAPTFTGDETAGVMISRTTANAMHLAPDSTVMAYFFDDNSLKVRKCTVLGIYETGFKDYDDNLVLADIRMIRTLNGWPESQSGGIEIKLADPSKTATAYNTLYDLLLRRTATGERYTMYTAQDANPIMYGWLDLLDTNVMLILVIMIAVAAMTMITGTIVLILDKVRAIATLKALGQSNANLRGVFHHMASFILLRGLLWGNGIALLIALIQKYTKVLKLDPGQYYMNHVPVTIDLLTIILTNVAAFVLIYLSIYIPTRIISRIRPADGIRFE